MSTAMHEKGTAGTQGPLWGARPIEWSETESQQMPTYEEAIRRVGLEPGDSVLDLGCGAGTFLRLAVNYGADPHGLDASQSLLDIASERVPDAYLRQGDLQFLPFGDDSFDLVTGFNSFFFAADMTAALREARRVAKPGANVLVQVWGRPERCDLTTLLAAIGSLRSDAPAPPALWKAGVLEGIAVEAGLEPQDAFDYSYPFDYPDEATLVRRMLAPGGVVDAAREAGEERVARIIVESLAPCQRPDGSYRLDNEWHYLLARA